MKKCNTFFHLIPVSNGKPLAFNSKHEFNNPCGMRYFNDAILEKLISYSRVIKQKNCTFYSRDYLLLEDEIDSSDFVYMDPPYFLTTGSYNDGKRGFKGWDKALEGELFDFIDRLNHRSVRFMLSYIEEHKGVKNEDLLNWIEENGYRVVYPGEITGISGSRRKEVLVVNYDS